MRRCFSAVIAFGQRERICVIELEITWFQRFLEPARQTGGSIEGVHLRCEAYEPALVELEPFVGTLFAEGRTRGGARGGFRRLEKSGEAR